jgi:hypothetical protein
MAQLPRYGEDLSRVSEWPHGHDARDRQSRFPDYRPGTPVVHMVNDLFHQAGEHKNLFDYPLLEWALVTAGIRHVTRVKEKDLLARFPDFPERGDDLMTLYVVATKG